MRVWENQVGAAEVHPGGEDLTLHTEEGLAHDADAAGVLHQKIALEGVDHNDPEMFSIPVVNAVEDLADEVAP